MALLTFLLQTLILDTERAVLELRALLVVLAVWMTLFDMQHSFLCLRDQHVLAPRVHAMKGRVLFPCSVRRSGDGLVVGCLTNLGIRLD